MRLLTLSAALLPTAFQVTVIAGVIVLIGSACRGREEAFRPEVPELAPLPQSLDPELFVVPADNPITPAKVALGWQLFYDVRLSVDNTISCASCHLPSAGFADPRTGSVGVGAAVGGRQAPTVINAAFNGTQFWDGRSPSLEHQALGPIQNPIEMAFTLEGLEQRLNMIRGYRQQFQQVFGADSISADLVAKAIASFERVVLSGNSPWDRWEQERDTAAVSEAARRGGELASGKARCTACHAGTTFSDAPFDLYHNIGVGMNDAEPDPGRYGVTEEEEDMGTFKTPTLRHVTETAPYMHDGSIATLAEVIDYYDGGGEPNQWLDVKMRPLGLTDQEKEDLLAFLETLSGQVPEWTRRAPPLPPSETQESQ